MNTDDMLIKQVLGRYSDNLLTIKTTISNYEEFKIDEQDMRKIIDQRMAEAIAHKIIADYDLRDVKVETDPEYMGKVITMKTYCLSKAGLISLITNAFNAGVESTKGSDESE
jgi:hypothetical protein